jgi:nucleotide-binding universal stress UspA family protein
VSTILIGVDASDRSEDAVALGRRLAMAGDARVVTAAVTPSDHPQRDEAHATVRRMSGLLAGIAPERIRTAVVAGRSPAQALHQLAESDHAAVIVVGSTHRVRLGRVQPGGTGERVLAGAPCAVAFAPHGFRAHDDRPVRRVGVAFDGSAESHAAFAAALTAARVHDAVLEVITVIPVEVLGAPAFGGAPEHELIRSDVEAVLRQAQRDAVSDLPDGTRVEALELEGHPASVIAERTPELDLLFIGSRGYGPLHAVFTGSTSGPVLRSAHCPVIVLPRGVETPLADVFEATAATQRQ